MTATAPTIDADSIIAAQVDELWDRIGYLTLLAPKLMRLKTRLDDPALADHPKRGHAELRYAAMKKRRASCMARIAALWEALPGDAQGEVYSITDKLGWGINGVSGVDVANAIWAAAKRPDAGAFGKEPW